MNAQHITLHEPEQTSQLQETLSKTYATIQKTQNLGSISPLEILPPEVFFKEIEVEQSYETSIIVRNISCKVKRIRVAPPKTGKFLIDPETKESVAPGLPIKILVAFETDELGDFHDELVIECDDYLKVKDHTKREISQTYKQIVKLHAYKPGPDIQFDPFIDLGFIQKDRETTKTIYFQNEGSEEGDVALQYDNAKETLQLSKSNFKLAPKEKTDVILTYRPKEAGLFRVLINVIVDGQVDVKHIDVNATPVEYQVHLIAPTIKIQKPQEELIKNLQQGSSLYAHTNSITFGSVYFGESKKVEAFIVNGGPKVLTYKIQFIPVNEEDEPDKDINFLTPFELGKQEMSRVMTADPMRGTVNAMSQAKITFICNSKKLQSDHGWTSKFLQSDKENFQNEHTDQQGDYQYTCLISFNEINDMNLAINLNARAVPPQVKLSRGYIAFGECPVQERRDAVLKIENFNQELPIQFSFPNVAQFKAVPCKGKLLPHQEQTITISFQAHNFGVFSKTMFIQLLNGLYEIPLKLSGMSISSGHRDKAKRGPEALPEDYQ